MQRKCPKEKSVLFSSCWFWSSSVTLYGNTDAQTAKPENRQLAASTTSLSQWDCFLEGGFAIDVEIVLGGVPCLPSPESSYFTPCLSCCSHSAAFLNFWEIFFSHVPFLFTSFSLGSHFLFTSIFSSFSSFVYAFGSVASRLVVTAHPISPLPCQYQETSTCLQMRERHTVWEEREAGVQHLWIIDMGQKGDITKDQTISSTLAYTGRCSLVLTYLQAHTVQYTH